MMNTNPPQPNADVEVQRVGFNSNIEQIQAFLTANYEFKFNSITQTVSYTHVTLPTKRRVGWGRLYSSTRIFCHCNTTGTF